ncbi:MAG: peptidoglycan DD-metalloendopeptidase family protein [Lachnospiraceae bacterium]|nr:peptidoglycan DD-metalloendopeptidase family protein [Lachnospiraceae bacterium]
MRRFRQLVCVILSLIMILSIASYGKTYVQASEITNESIQKKEAEIAEAQKEKKQLQSGLTDVKKLKQQLEASKADLNEYVTRLDSQLSEIQEKINSLTEQIAKKEEEIVQKEKELDEALAVQQAQYDAMKIRIKFMYERGDKMYMDIMLAARSFGDFLNKAEYIEKLSAYDKRMLDEYVEYSEYVALCKTELEDQRDILNETKTAQEEEEKALEELVKEKEAEINKLSSDISTKSAAIAEYEAQIASENETIKALEAAVAEERRKLAEGMGRKYDGGKFCNPCPSVVRISDDYGNRIHPTLGTQKFHNGIDMAAPGGSPILAAYTGKVVAADYSSSMGNYVMIDHGDSLYTIYMHASALYVSKGQEVAKGQKIAAVGTTGRSTGNHLHFGVRLNGNYVSPWNYLSR